MLPTVTVLSADLINPSTGRVMFTKGQIVNREVIHFANKAGIVYMPTVTIINPLQIVPCQQWVIDNY